MIRFLTYSTGILILWATVFIGCNSICENPDLHDLKELCTKIGDTLLIADFETGINPTECNGNLTKWNDDFSNIIVQVDYDTLGGGSRNSKYYAKVEIMNNDTIGSGGGMVLTFSDKVKGHDLSDYQFLQFEVKTFPVSRLEYTEIKLEDILGTERPKRPFISYGIELDTFWQTVSIPLEDFTSSTITPPLNMEKAIRFVTISEKNGWPWDVVGVLGVDNIRFVR